MKNIYQIKPLSPEKMAKGLIDRQGVDNAKAIAKAYSVPEFQNSGAVTRNIHMNYWVAVGNYIKYLTKS